MTAELGTTSDPKALIPGDPGALHQTQTAMTAYGDVLLEAGEGLTQVDTDAGWHGPAGDQFRARFTGKPEKWTQAGQCFHSAAAALVTYAEKLTWAQSEASGAIDLWNQGEAATTADRAAHDQAVAKLRADAAANPLVPANLALPVIPFVDSGEAKRQAARTKLDNARRELKVAGDAAERIVDAGRDKAPQEPDFWDDVGNLLGDVGNALENIGIDVLNGLASMGQAMANNPLSGLEMAGGAALMALGAGGEVLGGALDLTGIGALVGVPVNVVSAGIVATGAGVAGDGMLRMARDAADNPVEVVERGGSGGNGGPPRVTSEIDESNRLVKEAAAAGLSDQAGLDSLTTQLSHGNLNPGIGTRRLWDGVFEARSASGARVYFRNANNSIQIVAKSTKANQDTVIATLRRMYG